MEIKYPYNLTGKKYGKFAHNFVDCNDTVRSAVDGRIVIFWDDTEDDEYTPTRQVGFLQGVSYNREGPQYTVLTQSDCILTYDHAMPITEEHCPRVFVKDESGAAVGRLIGVQCDCDKKNLKFFVRLLPFESGLYNTLTADKLMFVDNAPMGVGAEGANE